MASETATEGRAVPAGDVAGSPTARPRLDSIDLLRGLAMVIMVLDHSRDWFSPTLSPQGSLMAPELLDDPAPFLFFTRWITHFCAPVFVFLAGAGAWLYGSRPGRTRGQLSRFLATRGLWLVLLEFTVVLFAWLFVLTPGYLIGQVIWAIGASMLVLSLLVFLPRGAIFALGAVIVLGHNALDGLAIEAEALALGQNPVHGVAISLWKVLHVQGVILLPWPFGSGSIAGVVFYPLLPWIGVLCLGYAFGPVLQRPAESRNRSCVLLGLAAIAAFVVLRASNVYGDPAPFVLRESAASTVIAFFNVAKYPPSLLFVLMTLGPTLALMPLWTRLSTGAGRALVTIGRVPLLYYVAHLYLLHGMAVAWAVARFGPDAAGWGITGGYTPGYDLGLGVAYAAWAIAVVALYPLCRWFAGVKQRSSAWWLSYL